MQKRQKAHGSWWTNKSMTLKSCQLCEHHTRKSGFQSLKMSEQKVQDLPVLPEPAQNMHKPCSFVKDSNSIFQE